MLDRLCYSLIVLNICFTSVAICYEERKSSLTFVFDITASMQSDIRGVKGSAQSIFDAVFNSPNSPIGMFNIVTYAFEPQVLIKTNEREKFEKALRSIAPRGGGSCPEITFTAIEMGLRESEKDSYLIVFTDAPVSDAHLYDKAKNLALNSNIKIIFLLTDLYCQGYTRDDTIFEELADASGGQVFKLHKKDIKKIIVYIQKLIESRKTELAKMTFPPGYGHEYNCSIDSGISRVIIVVTGDKAELQVKNSSLDSFVTTPIYEDSNNRIIDLKIIKPGDLHLELGSLNDTKMTLLGSTDINFGYGFSAKTPTSLNDTTNRPVPDDKSHVLIEANSDGEKVNVTKIELVYINGSVIAEYPMHIIGSKKQFYMSEPIIAPNDTFKIKITSVKESTHEVIVRYSNPVEVQKIVGTVEKKAPLVNIIGEPKLKLNYGDPLQMECVVSGYPQPHIIWTDESGSHLKATNFTKKLPYDYISILKLDKTTRSSSFSCTATNEISSQVKSVNVEIKRFFQAVNISTDKVIEYNKEDILYCKVDASPPATITWRLNGKEIVDNEDMSISADRFSLIIKKMNPKYAGEVTCEVKNALEKNIYPMKISVSTTDTVYKAPLVNIIGETDIKSDYGKPLQLNCVVTGNPEPNIIWEDDTGAFLNSTVTSKNIDEYISTLNIERIIQSNKFSCKASNDLGSKTESVKVDINPFIEVVDISKDKVIQYNKGDVLFCNVKANPPAKITWRLNGKQIDTEKDISISPDSSNLMIKHMKPQFDGSFTCEVDNDFIKKVYTIKVSVSGLDGPTIDKHSTQMIASRLESVIIPCRIIQGMPKPTIQWFFKSKSDKPFVKIEEHNEDLHIRSATESSAGTYKCEAKNIIDIDTHTVQLIIEDPVTVDIPKQTTYNVTVGKSIVLKCNMRGYPTPKIKWRFVSEDISVKDIDGGATLELVNMQSDESGYYICYTQTRKGFVNLSYTVNVITPPSINAFEKNINAIAGDVALTIKCPVTGNPMPVVSWYKDGNPLTIGTEWYDMNENGTLLMKNVESSYAGVYNCKAQNEFGEAFEKFVVTVKDYPDPRKIRNNFKVYIEKGHDKDVKCGLQHSPTDLVRWYSSRSKSKGLVDTGTLSIRNFTKDQIYICHVSNLTSKPVSALVYCLTGSKPKFTKTYNELRPRNFRDDDRWLGCDANGSPKAKVTWTFNGAKLRTTYEFSHVYEASVSSIGLYECVAENELGKINRTFNVTREHCTLDIKTDFDRRHPQIVIEDNDNNKEILDDGYMCITATKSTILYCPGGFNELEDTEVEATCIDDRKFKFNNKIMEYSSLKCVEEFTPTTVKTGKTCGDDTEIIKIGINTYKTFEEVYRICFHKGLNIPLYEEHSLTNFRAGVQSEHKHSWFNSDIINYDITEMFDCKQQMEYTAKNFKIRTDEDCCYSLRQLVNEKDVQPGYAQIATYSYLNIIPHCNSCGMENWNALEELLRNKTRFCKRKCFVVVTGILQSFQLPVGGSNVTVHIKDKSDRKMVVPVFLWKVIKDLDRKTSVAIIQLNIPYSLRRFIRKPYLCRDICNQIKWMNSIDRTDEKKGLMYCCSTKEFEKWFSEGLFTQGKYVNPLTDID